MSFALIIRSASMTFAVAMTSTVTSAAGLSPTTTVIDYDTFSYGSLEGYQAKWETPYGLGEMATADGDKRFFDGSTFSIDASPFQTAYDFSVYDHIKYLAISSQAFPVPERGSVTFSIDIQAETLGTRPGYVVNGTYPSGAPYSAIALQGQQAGATLHMIDFATGQLFDWFVSGNTAFTLIERLPSNVTKPELELESTDQAYVGISKMYTQIIDEVPITPGVSHTVATTYTRGKNKSTAEYFLDGKRVSKVDRVGVPLDVQHAKYTGIYPSLGRGEVLKDKVNHLVIGHGVFSLIDAFPFQHPEAPELSVSIPVENRIFGQGVRATFDNVQVTTVNHAGP